MRLEDDKKNNLEEGFPTSCPLRANDEQMTATIYAFRKGKAKTYRNDEGTIFTLNGQTHGYLTPPQYVPLRCSDWISKMIVSHTVQQNSAPNIHRRRFLKTSLAGVAAGGLWRDMPAVAAPLRSQ